MLTRTGTGTSTVATCDLRTPVSFQYRYLYSCTVTGTAVRYNKGSCMQQFTLHVTLNSKPKLTPPRCIGLSSYICCAVPTALLPLPLSCTAEVTTPMYWFLLIIASSMCNGDNLRLLPLAPPRTHLPPCDVFLAPSTIPGSACMENMNK